MPVRPVRGQFLIGDVTYGGLQRGFLEKVNGEYQGALFRLTQGLEAGVAEVNLGPDGAIYVGGLGAGGNWGQAGKLTYGLQKLTPNGANTFDMLAMRATVQRLRDRVHPAGVGRDRHRPGHASTRSSSGATCRPPAYGGPKIDEETLSVSSATLSADGRKVTLVINGLQAGRVVHIRSPRPFSSSNGQSLWSTEVWYTLNAIPGQQPADNLALGKPATADSSCAATEGPAKAVNGSVTGGNTDKWCSQGATKWLQVDLGTSQSVNQVVVKHAGAGGENTAWNTRDFNIQVEHQRHLVDDGQHRHREHGQHHHAQHRRDPGQIRAAEHHHAFQRWQHGGTDLRIRGLRRHRHAADRQPRLRQTSDGRQFLRSHRRSGEGGQRNHHRRWHRQVVFIRGHQVAAGRPRYQPDGEPVHRQARRRRRREHGLEHA